MRGRSHLTITHIAEMDPNRLADEWARRYGAPAPSTSPELLRLGLAYKVQERRHGGVSRTTKTVMKRALMQAEQPSRATPPARKLTPGTRLVRDWHGVGHTVIVLEEGFEYDGKRWASLSAIAKAITGAHWNGPYFFGLTERRR